MTVKQYLSNVVYSLDQLANTLLGGYVDESLSARAYRFSSAYHAWFIIMTLINGLAFNRNHCKHAYEHEVDLPPEYKKMV